MGEIKTFRDLIGWQKSMDLAEEIYRITEVGRFSRDFALRDQIRRATISIPSNIAEGFERFNPAEYHQFLVIAKGSSAEMRTQLELAYRVGHIDVATYEPLIAQAEEVAKLLNGMRRAAEKRKGEDGRKAR